MSPHKEHRQQTPFHVITRRECPAHAERLLVWFVQQRVGRPSRALRAESYHRAYPEFDNRHRLAQLFAVARRAVFKQFAGSIDGADFDFELRSIARYLPRGKQDAPKKSKTQERHLCFSRWPKSLAVVGPRRDGSRQAARDDSSKPQGKLSGDVQRWRERDAWRRES